MIEGLLLSLRFSGDYWKLPVKWVGLKARLLFVRRILLEEQSPALLDFDVGRRDGSRFEFPADSGPYLFLLFELERGLLFQTLRRWSPDKERFYRGSIGRVFELKEVEARA